MTLLSNTLRATLAAAVLALGAAAPAAATGISGWSDIGPGETIVMEAYFDSWTEAWLDLQIDHYGVDLDVYVFDPFDALVAWSESYNHNHPYESTSWFPRMSGWHTIEVTNRSPHWSGFWIEAANGFPH